MQVSITREYLLQYMVHNNDILNLYYSDQSPCDREMNILQTGVINKH